MNHQPIKILLADDDSDDRLFFELALKELQIAADLKTVIDGEKLLNYLSKNTNNFLMFFFSILICPEKVARNVLKN